MGEGSEREGGGQIKSDGERGPGEVASEKYVSRDRMA